MSCSQSSIPTHGNLCGFTSESDAQNLINKGSCSSSYSGTCTGQPGRGITCYVPYCGCPGGPVYYNVGQYPEQPSCPRYDQCSPTSCKCCKDLAGGYPTLSECRSNLPSTCSTSPGSWVGVL